jgi:hypothetical protein
MLAPPEKRRRKNRAHKRASRAREKAGLHRVQLWLSTLALEGLINQLVVIDRRLTDKQATDQRLVESALAELLETQGMKWAR